MKKSNVVVFALLVLLSAFLLWLWYYLGFNRVDNPFDLVLSIIWWVVIALSIVVIVRLEQVRRRRIRTVYVGDRSAFNSEKGLLLLDAAFPVQDSVAAVLDDLKYNFTREDFPEPDDFQPRYFIRTDKFEAEKKDDEANGASAADEAAEVAADLTAAIQPATDASVAVASEAAQPVANVSVAAADTAVAETAATTAIVADIPQVYPTTWKGEVVVVGDDDDPRTFDTPEELATILASLTKAA
ncbi:hypothetical protein [Adlercreutzia sp. ZJ141]|uniref:hypothetical protein n=1 Tax=Adlercreutzia sp. ZJ141 TaxID=2709406 RepID=UPI0013EDE15A|nr:hypothetical protein [Adlercreutzia sp. ZJ141]